FHLEGEKVLAVGGGSGMASMIAAIEAFAQQGARVVTAVGAKTAAELMFVERANSAGEVHIAPDDGSRGFAGFAPALAEKLVDREKFDQILTCGPERMMKAVVDFAKKRDIPVQASVERYMKCGIGICDACSLDDQLVCLDGPIFTAEQPVCGEARGLGEPPERLPDLDLRVRGNRHVAIDASGCADGRRRAVPALHAFLRSAAAATRQHHRTTRTVARLLGGDEGADSSPDQDLVRDFPRGGATRPR